MSKKIREALDDLAGPEAKAAIKALGEISAAKATEEVQPGLVAQRTFSEAVNPAFANISESLRPYSSANKPTAADAQERDRLLEEAIAKVEMLKESLSELASSASEAETARAKADRERDLNQERQHKLTRRIVLVGILAALAAPWIRPQPQQQPQSQPVGVDLTPIEFRLDAIERSLKPMQSLLQPE